jgi:hypothetical protein
VALRSASPPTGTAWLAVVVVAFVPPQKYALQFVQRWFVAPLM